MLRSHWRLEAALALEYFDLRLVVRLESPWAKVSQPDFQLFAVGTDRSTRIGSLRIVLMLLKVVSVASRASY